MIRIIYKTTNLKDLKQEGQIFLLSNHTRMEVKVYLPSTNFNPAPIVLSFSPDTPAKDIVCDLSQKFHVQGEERSLVITPTSATTGGVVDPRTSVKSFNLDIEV